MNYSNNKYILDLPDEILLIIFKKLNIIDVLYSLVDVNQRFDRLALNSLYIHDLDMTTIMTNDSIYNHTFSMDTQVVSRICQKVLPRIDHQIHKLTIEECSMKPILLAANYPQLYSLSLINFDEEILYQYLTDDLILRDLLTKQITHLNIDIKPITERFSETVSKIFGLILSLCKNLTVLNFCDMFLTRNCVTPAYYLSMTSHMSSTLIKLNINVVSLTDCLLLLDERLDSLSTLIINVSYISHPSKPIDRTKKLPKLKYFSLTSFYRANCYDDLIVPLLCRMINLEELKLYLQIRRYDSTYIDGVQLYDQILIYMTRLNKFTFSIDTTICNEDVILELQSNEDIQRSFIGRGYQQVVSYVHTISMNTEGKCHFYSLPYEFEYFHIEYCFQGGMFHKVRYLNIDDTIPFEHELFQLISQEFPFLEFLYISHDEPQEDKQHSSTLITFPHLKLLDLKWAHVDYAEQLLLKKNAHLPRLLNLCIEDKSLITITNNFTTDPTHFNFGTLTNLDVCQPLARFIRQCEPFVRPENFLTYFPLL